MALPHLQTIDTRPIPTDYLPAALPAMQSPVVTIAPLLPAMEPEPYHYRYLTGYEPPTRDGLYTIYIDTEMRNRHDQKMPYISSRMSIDSSSPVEVISPVG